MIIDFPGMSPSRALLFPKTCRARVAKRRSLLRFPIKCGRMSVAKRGHLHPPNQSTHHGLPVPLFYWPFYAEERL